MKKIVIIVAMALLVINGCSKKNPQPNDANQISEDTISLDESGVNSNGSGVNDRGYNSSSDGMQSIYFEFDQYSISSDMEQKISLNANVLRQKLGSNKVKLEGNCDEFGSDEYNQALGLKRAKAVKDALVMQGINPSQIALISYGENNPKCTQMNESCYAQNRRVDLHLLR